MELPGFAAGCAAGAGTAAAAADRPACAAHVRGSNTVINRLARNMTILQTGVKSAKAGQLLWRQLEADLPDERCYTPELPF
jgi:hypothetical protein